MYLAGSSAKTAYDNLKEAGYFNNVISANINQQVKMDSISLDPNTYPYTFTCYATEKLIRATSTVTRKLITQGKISDLKTETDNNPHGFLIQRWQILQKSDPKAYYDEQLEEIFPGFSEAAIPSHLQNWPAEDYIKTGYLFPGNGELCGKVQFLNQVYQKRLFFAGEHICPGFWGFMEGALQSGIIAAKNIQLAAAKDNAEQ